MSRPVSLLLALLLALFWGLFAQPILNAEMDRQILVAEHLLFAPAPNPASRVPK